MVILSFWISIGFLVYYLIYQGLYNFIKAGIATNSPSKVVAELRNKYKVNIKTFNKNSNHVAFAWLKSIWINEKLLKNRKALMFAFHHEHYHVMNKHVQKNLLIRLGIALFPLLLSVMHWAVFCPIALCALFGAKYTLDRFEVKADEHAYNMLNEEGR